MLLATSASSDHFRERGFHLASALCFVIIGCAILASIPVTNLGVGYFATFMVSVVKAAIKTVLMSDHIRRVYALGHFPLLASMQRPHRGRTCFPSRSVDLPRQLGWHRFRKHLPRQMGSSLRYPSHNHRMSRITWSCRGGVFAHVDVGRQQKEEQGARRRAAIERCPDRSTLCWTCEPVVQAFLLGIYIYICM